MNGSIKKEPLKYFCVKYLTNLEILVILRFCRYFKEGAENVI